MVGWEVDPPTKYSKKGGGVLKRLSSFWSRVAEKEGVTFFRGGGIAILNTKQIKI